MSQVGTKVAPRQITDDEVAFYRENGWVHLEQLISEDAAQTMLGELQGLMGPDASIRRHPDAGPAQDAWFSVYAPLSIENETAVVHSRFFHDFSHSPELGAVGARLSGEPMRYWTDLSLVKTPSGSQRGGATPWHSDIATVETCPFSKHGQMQMWFALVPIAAENGTMRFIAPKDASDEVRAICGIGAARAMPGETSDTDDVDSTYPRLEELGVISEPLNMRAGDATIHGSQTLHSAPANVTATPRWVYTCSLFPADATFSGNRFWPMFGVEGVEEGKAFPDHRFPVVA